MTRKALWFEKKDAQMEPGCGRHFPGASGTARHGPAQPGCGQMWLVAGCGWHGGPALLAKHCQQSITGPRAYQIIGVAALATWSHGGTRVTMANTTSKNWHADLAQPGCGQLASCDRMTCGALVGHQAVRAYVASAPDRV